MSTPARTTPSGRWPLAASFLLLEILGCTRTSPQVSAWVVDWRTAHLTNAIESVEAANGFLTEIDFFRFHFDPQGRVKPGGDLTTAHRNLARLAREKGIAQLVTIVNDTVGADGRAVRLKDPDLVHDVLADPSRRKHLISELREVVRRETYSGIDIDLENLHGADRDAFSEFIAALARGIHEDGKRLVVTVHPQLRPERRDGPGAQDLAALARHADEIRVMAYHVHYEKTEPGPSAPLPWLEKLIAYNLEQVPAERLSMALYVGGWRWQEGRGEKITFAEAIRMAQELNVPIRRSEEHRVPYFQAETPRGPIEVWFEDACSLLAKGELIARHRLRGIALWHLGNEDPALFSALGAKTCRPSEVPDGAGRVARPSGDRR